MTTTGKLLSIFNWGLSNKEERVPGMEFEEMTGFHVLCPHFICPVMVDAAKNFFIPDYFRLVKRTCLISIHSGENSHLIHKPQYHQEIGRPRTNKCATHIDSGLRGRYCHLRTRPLYPGRHQYAEIRAKKYREAARASFKLQRMS